MMDLKEKIPIMHCAGVEGPSLYINNYRVCGPKPWGGGKVIKEWKDAEKGDILHALGDDFVQAVNAHEALVDLIKSIKAIESLWLPTKADPEHFDEAKALYGMKERIDAALRKAGAL